MPKDTKVVTADEALEWLQPGMVLAATGLSSEPVALLEALARRVGQDCPVTLVAGMMLDGYKALAPHLGNSIEFETWFLPQTLLGKIDIGEKVNFLPMTWAQVCRYIPTRQIDVGMVQVSPADADGYHSLGISVSLNRTIVNTARVLIGQVNQQMPYTHGETLVHQSEFDYLVHDTRQLRPFPHRSSDERDVAIARRVAELVSSGSTIQVGVGTIPSEVLRALAVSDRTGLRVHSQVTDAGRELMESGRCAADNPVAVVGDILGTRELYKWVDHNEAVNLVDGLQTHGLGGLARLTSFVSINSTLEVDLYGQLNSEILDAGQAGGIGGSVDFMMGAQLDGSRSIIALPSTTARGDSRIVPTITRGIVTVPRSLVQYVVTEYGTADLRYLTASQRAAALAALAHPDHRDDLLRAAASIS